MWFPYVNWESAQTLCFTVASFRQYENEEQKMAVYYKTRTKIGDTERHWRLPSPPIVGEKHVVSLCKFESVLIYTWIAKPFILPLQIFDTHKLSFRNRKTRTKLAAYERDWRLPSSPIVGEKHVVSLCKLGKCPNPFFYRCKFSAILK